MSLIFSSLTLQVPQREETTTSRKWSRAGNISSAPTKAAEQQSVGEPARSEWVHDTLSSQDERRSGRFELSACVREASAFGVRHGATGALPARRTSIRSEKKCRGKS